MTIDPVKKNVIIERVFRKLFNGIVIRDRIKEELLLICHMSSDDMVEDVLQTIKAHVGID